MREAELSEVGGRVRFLRRLLNLTQADLAGRIEVNPQTVSDWERGKRRPRDRNLQAIASLTRRPFVWSGWLISGGELPETVLYKPQAPKIDFENMFSSRKQAEVYAKMLRRLADLVDQSEHMKAGEVRFWIAELQKYGAEA
jgi:transcriptional regulator with XRE-family HTH domain